MRTRVFAAMAYAFVMPAAPAFAQLDAAVAQGAREIRSMQQQSLHDDARDYRELSSSQLGKIIGKYRAETEPYRQNAVQVAAQARASSLPAGSGVNIRNALEADMTLWYNSTPVSKRDWDKTRAQWLVPVSSLTDQQWALQRAAWFTARDAWLDKRMQEAQLARH